MLPFRRLQAKSGLLSFARLATVSLLSVLDLVQARSMLARCDLPKSRCARDEYSWSRRTINEYCPSSSRSADMRTECWGLQMLACSDQSVNFSLA